MQIQARLKLEDSAEVKDAKILGSGIKNDINNINTINDEFVSLTQSHCNQRKRDQIIYRFTMDT